MELGTVEYVSELRRSDIIGRLSIPCGASLVARADIDASGIAEQYEASLHATTEIVLNRPKLRTANLGEVER